MLASAWLQLGAEDRHNGAAVTRQRHADDTEGAELDRLIAVIGRGRGRTYAGLPSKWGQDFTIGTVPVFKYLESRDIDEVGYTLRTASLMTDPEYDFNDRNPSDYRLFAIHYLIIPSGSRPPIPAALELRAGPYSLWTLPGAGGVLRAGTIVGRLSANRTDIGTRSIALLNAPLAQAGDYLRVDYGHADRNTTPPPQPAPAKSSGTISAESDTLPHGLVAASVRMHRAGVVVLSASFDPGWRATIDGRRQRTEMVAPALIATTVPTGTHRISFSYHGWHNYSLLFAISAAALLALAVQAIRTARPGRIGRGH